MSKNAQRLNNLKAMRQRLYDIGKKQAELEASCVHGHVLRYYATSMAWRAGYLQAGGEKYW